jgi:hypothetical protein
MTRIQGGGVSTRNPFGPDWAKGAGEARTVGEQVQHDLFGKPKPKVLDQDDADVAAQMARLHAYRRKIARLAGDDEDDYDLVLAEGTIAMIDAQGRVYVGKRFLLDHADHVEVQVGVLAHEIGHRPKRWAEYQEAKKLTKEERERLCRLEETRADYFAGRALAELGLPCEPLCAFLRAVAVHPHPEYFDAATRADVVREGHGDGARRAKRMKAMFPELARATSAKGDLGNG